MGTEKLPADSLAEKRYASRKPVALALRAWVNGEERSLAFRDLSHTGFLVEATPPLTLDQTIEVEVPHEGRKTAKVVWAGGTSAGCTFDEPISKASLSAALLQSKFMAAPATAEPKVAEPIVYSSEDEYPDPKLPVPARLAVIAMGSVLAWIPLLLIGSVLLG